MEEQAERDADKRGNAKVNQCAFMIDKAYAAAGGQHYRLKKKQLSEDKKYNFIIQHTRIFCKNTPNNAKGKAFL